MTKQRLLIKLGILIPQNTACYRNNIAITDTNFNWINPITYIYLLIAIVHLGYMCIKHGKDFPYN